VTRLRAPRRLHTERLTLEATESSHAPGLNRSILASLEELGPWMAWVADPALVQTRSFTLGAEEGWNRASGWIFTILLEDEPVGTVGLDRYQPLLDQAQLGYWIRTDLSGRGLMKEAARSVVDFAFDDLHLHRLELHASPDNIASVKVAEALGFQREGLARDIARNVTGFYDCIVFGLLESDPRP
jgi:ribosomal-protein-serine acetyltransferase